jgi:hypothetical protein
MTRPNAEVSRASAQFGAGDHGERGNTEAMTSLPFGPLDLAFQSAHSTSGRAAGSEAECCTNHGFRGGL